MRTAGIIVILLICAFPGRTQPFWEGRYFSNQDTVLLSQTLQHAKAQEKLVPDSAGLLYSGLIRESLVAGYRNGIVQGYNGQGRILLGKGRYEEALLSLRKALSFCDTLHYGNDMARICSNMGNACNYLGRYIDAASFYHRSAILAERYPDPGFPPAYAWSNLATVLAQLKQYDKALYYTDKALKAAREDDHKFIANLLMNKGAQLLEKKMLPQAARYLDAAVAYAGRHGLYTVQHMALINSANLHMSTGELPRALREMLAARALEERYPVAMNEKNVSLSAIGDVYLQLEDYDKAREYFLQASGQTELLPKERLFLLAKSAELAGRTGAYQEAYRLQQDYYRLKDSLQGREVAGNVNELETRYRTAEKDKRLAQQQSSLIKQQLKLDRKNLWIGISGGTILLLLLLLGFRQLYQRQLNKLARRNREIERLQARIEGEEQERQRLAQELHDGVNNQLAGAKAYLSTLGNLFPDISREPYYRKTGQILDTAAAELRRTAHHLLPDVVGRKGLAEAIREFCDQLDSQSGTRVEFHAYGRFDRNAPELSLNIYRMVQELTGNILKHAAATEATVLLNEHPDEISLIVEDNGRGMPPVQEVKGIGLLNIRQRVEACKGSLQIEAGNPGTIISIFLPRKAAASATGNPNLH